MHRCWVRTRRRRSISKGQLFTCKFEMHSVKVKRTLLMVLTYVRLFSWLNTRNSLWLLLSARNSDSLQWVVIIELLSRFFINFMFWRAPYVPIDIAQSYNCMKRSHNGWLADHATRYYLLLQFVIVTTYLLSTEPPSSMPRYLWLRKRVITADTIITSPFACDFEHEIVKT